MLRVSKYLFVIGIPIISMTIILLTIMYGVLASKDIENNSEKSNVILSKTISNVLWPQIQGLAKSAHMHQKGSGPAAVEQGLLISNMIKVMLDEPINEMVQGTNIIRLEMYSPDGLIIYSTDNNHIGERKKSDSAGISRAIEGLPTTRVGFYENYISLASRELNNGYVLSSYIPVINDEDQVEGIFVIYSDVTDVYDNIGKSQRNYALALTIIFTAIFFLLLYVLRKFDRVIQRNIELAIARDGEKDANKAKSQFLANMSHELRTPLNAIIGYSELLKEDMDPGDTGTVERDLSNITSSAKHLLSIINEVLDLSKIEAGQMSLCLEDLNVENLIDNVCLIIRPLAEKNNNKFKWYCKGLPYIYSDTIRIRQILLNLLSNSAKFTEGGSIMLRAKVKGAWLVLKVEDTGIGMTEVQMGRLFKPFMQADESTTRKFGGTGLGLSISKQLVELMGGSIFARSESGNGTIFTVRIPANLDKVQSAKLVAV